jgi:hypothetical protein
MDKSEDKTLFSVSRIDDVFTVFLDCDDDNELYQVCIGIIQALRNKEEFADMLQFVNSTLVTNPDARDYVDAQTVKGPDFNDILKNIDNESKGSNSTN